MFSKKFMMAVFVLLLLVTSFITQKTARYILTEFHLLAFNHQLQKQTVSLQSVEEGLLGWLCKEWVESWVNEYYWQRPIPLIYWKLTKPISHFLGQDQKGTGVPVSTYKWLTSICKTSNCDFHFWNVYSLRLPVYRFLLYRLPNSAVHAVHNEHAEVHGCCSSWCHSIRVHTTHKAPTFWFLLFLFPYSWSLPHSLAVYSHIKASNHDKCGP